MYLSRITLHTGQLSPAQLLHLVDRGEYVMHQWLWDLFPGGKERQFLYRREELQGAFRFFVLSQERPAETSTPTGLDRISSGSRCRWKTVSMCGNCG